MGVKKEEKLGRRRSWAEVRSQWGLSLRCGGSEAGMALWSCPNLQWLVIICGLPIGVQDPGAGNFQRGLTVNNIPTSSGNESFSLKRRLSSGIALMTALALFCLGLLCVNSGVSSYQILVGLWGKLTGGRLVRQTTTRTAAVSFKATNVTYSLSVLC